MPGAQEDDLVGERGRVAEIVRHHHHRLAALLVDAPQIRLQLGADDRIERAERLVEQQRLGIEHERAHQAHALALPARQLASDNAPSSDGGSRTSSPSVGDARVDLRARSPARRQRHVLDGGQVRKEPALLNDVADASPRRAAERPTVEEHLAGVGHDEPHEQAQQRRLAAARRAEQHRRPPAPKLEVDLDGELPAEGLAYRAERKHPRIIRQNRRPLSDGPLVHPQPTPTPTPVEERATTRDTLARRAGSHKLRLCARVHAGILAVGLAFWR